MWKCIDSRQHDSYCKSFSKEYIADGRIKEITMCLHRVNDHNKAVYLNLLQYVQAVYVSLEYFTNHYNIMLISYQRSRLQPLAS